MKLLAGEIVPVRPLATPSALIFYYDPIIIPNRVLYYDRDEFYAYDDELRIYLKGFYPEYNAA